METLTEAIARAVRMELGRRNMTDAAFALSIGTNKSNVSRWTNGQVEMKASTIELLARGLGMTPAELVAMAEAVREDDALSDPARNLRAVADEDPNLVAELEAQQEGP